MPEVSIICCVSRPDIFARCLLQSINDNRHAHDIEIIPVFNDGNRYSASNALNIGIDASRSDLLVFVHQDVRLLDGWFDQLTQVLEDLPDDYAIVGSAGIALEYGRIDIGRWGGAIARDTVAVGSVWDTDDNLNQPPYWKGITATAKVHCADECLLVLNKRTGLRFDSQFTGFHFYGVDLCLQARAAAYGVYCSHLPIIHYGSYSTSFTGDSRYWVYLRFLYNKWRARFPELLGTHFHWSQYEELIQGRKIIVPELTSYITVGLDGGDGFIVQAQMGLGRVKFKTDAKQGLLEL